MKRPWVASVALLVSLIILGLAPNAAWAKKKPPTCAISASPAVLAPGESSTLSWTATGAKTFKIDPVGDMLTAGSLTVMPAFTTNYVGTATGKGGVATCAVTVEIRTSALSGGWHIRMKDGIVVGADEAVPPRIPADGFFLHMQEGQVYESGHLYQGRIEGYHGSWVHAWFEPNVRPGHPKFLEITLGIPDGPGTFVLTCNLFLDEKETCGRGTMSGEYWLASPQGPFTEVPNELFIATCRIWR